MKKRCWYNLPIPSNKYLKQNYQQTCFFIQPAVNQSGDIWNYQQTCLFLQPAINQTGEVRCGVFATWVGGQTNVFPLHTENTAEITVIFPFIGCLSIAGWKYCNILFFLFIGLQNN